MVRYKLILAYDGSRFAGFQRQKNSRSVQAELERALGLLGWQGRSVLAAGRTDAGVHASGQVVTFDLDWQHADHDLQRALNANLPEDLAVQQVEQAAPGFHPRYDALARCYTYRIVTAPVRQPLLERYAWRVYPAPDLDRMHSASQMLVGVHDFRAFGAPHRPGGSTTREIFRAVWQQSSTELVFEVVGNAFLYHMVRRMVSLLAAVGQGKEELEQVQKYLHGEQIPAVTGLAPAAGLCLTRVIYRKADLPDKN